MSHERELRTRIEQLQAQRGKLSVDDDPQPLQREFELGVADIGREREHLLAEQDRLRKLLAEAEQVHQRAVSDAAASASPQQARGAMWSGLVGGLIVVAAIWFTLAQVPQFREGMLVLTIALTAWSAAVQRARADEP